MRIEGERGRAYLGFISPRIICKKPAFDSYFSMVVDTGASRTTISEYKAFILGIDFSNLSNFDIIYGIGGTCKCYFTEEVTLTFEVADEIVYKQKLDKIGIMKHEIESETCPSCGHKWKPREIEKKIFALGVPSLLGIDVLKNFKVQYTPKRVYLEKI